MGRSHYKIHENQALHFLSCTIINWLPLCRRQEAVQIILDALVWRQHKNVSVYGYVILENHLYFIFQADGLRQQILAGYLPL